MATNERLAALRQALDDAVLTHTGRSIGDLASERVLSDIMPEIEALRSDLMAIVRKVAAMTATMGNSRCDACGGERTTKTVRYRLVVSDDYEHAADCPIAEARAFVAQHPAQGAE